MACVFEEHDVRLYIYSFRFILINSLCTVAQMLELCGHDSSGSEKCSVMDSCENDSEPFDDIKLEVFICQMT
jgi:hypothetical protein